MKKWMLVALWCFATGAIVAWIDPSNRVVFLLAIPGCIAWLIGICTFD